MAGSIHDSDEMITGINITPMVDVVLVLLVIFMIAAPVLYQGSIPVQLPAAHSAQSSEKITLKFSLSLDGKLSLDRREIQASEVDALIKKARSLDPDADALVAADRSLSHGQVMEFIDRLREAGITRIGIAVETQKK